MTDIILKRGDTQPRIQYQLIGVDGDNKDITGYNEVKFFMQTDNYEIVVDEDTAGNVTVADQSAGLVEYSWKTSDTSETGEYYAEWAVEYGDGSKQTFPNDGFIDVKIVEDVQ